MKAEKDITKQMTVRTKIKETFIIFLVDLFGVMLIPVLIFSNKRDSENAKTFLTNYAQQFEGHTIADIVDAEGATVFYNEATGDIPNDTAMPMRVILEDGTSVEIPKTSVTHSNGFKILYIGYPDSYEENKQFGIKIYPESGRISVFLPRKAEAVYLIQ